MGPLATAPKTGGQVHALTPRRGDPLVRHIYRFGKTPRRGCGGSRAARRYEGAARLACYRAYNFSCSAWPARSMSAGAMTSCSNGAGPSTTMWSPSMTKLGTAIRACSGSIQATLRPPASAEQVSWPPGIGRTHHVVWDGPRRVPRSRRRGVVADRRPTSLGDRARLRGYETAPRWPHKERRRQSWRGRGEPPLEVPSRTCSTLTMSEMFNTG